MIAPAPAIRLAPCHFCDGPLVVVPGGDRLVRVTSDCRPWPRRSALAVCRHCALVQTPVDAAWHDDMAQLYRDYAVYAQAGGAEQQVFDQRDGVGLARSARLVAALAAAIDLPAHGRLLDFGCGNGAFLAAFGQTRPGWRLTGLDLSDRHAAAIRALPGVETFHSGSIESLTGRFDLIALIHSLEHIADPAGFLAGLRRLLAPGGRLIIETPDLATAPFDVTIADHVSHFTASTLHRVITAAGYRLATPLACWVPKELSMVVMAGSTADRPPPGQATAAESTGAVADTAAGLHWLGQVVDQARAAGPNLGVFGSSISGTWLAESLGGQVGCLIDEDPNRIGRQHIRWPIVAPAAVPAGSTVALPFPPAIAAGIAARLAPHGWTLLLPPPLADHPVEAGHVC